MTAARVSEMPRPEEKCFNCYSGARRLLWCAMAEETGIAGERHDDLDVVRRRLELAIAGAQLGVWTYDPRAGSCWFSDRSRELFGLDDNFMADARDLERHIHPDDWPRLAEPYYGAYPDEPLAIEFRVVLPDGAQRWIYALGAEVRDEAGQPTAVHGIHLDITEIGRAHV